MTKRTRLGLFGLLVVPGFVLLYFYACWLGSQESFEREAREEAAGKSEAQLHSVEAAIEEVALMHRLSKQPLDSKIMVEEIAKKEDPASLKCFASTNEWVSINPNFCKIDRSQFSNDVVVYCPYPGSNNNWIALSCLNGEVILSKRPDWQPVPIQTILGSPTP